LTINAQSNGKNVSDTFSITVNPVDDPPVVETLITDISVNEDAANQIIDLSNTFSDIDDTEIIKTILTNSDPALISASIVNDTLTISFIENQFGDADLTINAQSNGKNVSDTFSITVNPVDDPPTLETPITDISVNEDAANQTIDLSNTFADIDDTSITKSILTNSNPALLSASIVNDTLTIAFIANQFGDADLTINAQSNGKNISDTFSITVNSIDDPPTLETPITDISVNEDAANQTIDLSNTFSDIDDTEITKTILTNSDPALISASIVNDTLTIAFIENQFGDADLTINAQSNGKNISDTFSIRVNAVNDPPTISTISGQEVEDASVSIDYAINDIETAAENLSVTLQSSQPDILPILPENVLLSGTGASRSITLTPVEGSYGPCMLTLVVMDVSQSTLSSFVFENVHPTFTIVTLVNGNGTISPSGTINILKGNNKTLSILPSTGNRTNDIIINGESIGPKTQYTFWSVAQNYTIQANFTPIPAPVADFYAAPLSGDLPLIVEFVNTSQNEFSNVQWQFGDNSKSSATSPVHTYALPGQYTVCLILTGPGGTHALTKSAYIQVNERCDLNIQFSANNRIVPIQTDIQMTAIVSGLSADLIWDFGDGTTSQVRNPIHAYETPGLYSVSLTAIGSVQNCSVTTTKNDYIQVVGRSISGKVRVKGAGVPNSLVCLWKGLSQMEGFQLTDANGDYTFTSLSARSGWIISVTPPSSLGDQYMMQYYPDATLWEEAETLSTQNEDVNIIIDLIEPPDNGICGQITNGIEGIADAQVSIFSESLDLARTVISDDLGNYTITGLPMADDYIVSAFLDTINQEYFYAIPQGLTPGNVIPDSSVSRSTRATQIEPEEPYLQHINIIIQNGIIGGIVHLNGQPAPNLLVYAWSDDINCNNFSATNDNGQYTITGLMTVSNSDAFTKGYIVELQSPGYPYQVFDNQTNIEQATRVETGRQDINFQLFSDRQISGRLTDINQSPLSGALIQIQSDETETTAQTYSNENGYYTFSNLPVAADYYVYAYKQSYPLQYYLNAANKDQALVINVYDDHATNINFILDKGAVIKGQVSLLETGQPVGEGIWVNIWSENTLSGGDVSTDSNGIYEINGLDSDADDYIISIWHEDYINVFYSSSGVAYQYTEATPVAPSDNNRNLTLTPGFCIKGAITYLDMPVEDIQVWADGPTTGVATSQATTINNANYEICGLSPGSYEVKISSDQFLDQTYPSSVIIVDNNGTNIDFELTLPTRTLAGLIYHADMNEIVRLYARSNEFQEVIRITGTGEPVNFTFTNLQPASDYRLEIRPDNHDYQVYNNKTVLAEGNLIDLSTENINGLEITLTRSSGEIKGIVQFPNPLIHNDAVVITALFNNNQQVSIEIAPGSGGSIPYTLTGVGLVTDCEVRLTSEYYEQQVQIVNTLDTLPDNEINFILTPGGSISGQIQDADNEGLSGMNVMVWSDQLGMGGTAQTGSSGNYQVGGLNASADYYVFVQDNTTTFYYHTDGAVVQESRKEYLELNQGQSKTGIDIVLFVGDCMEGVVRNASGSPLANVYITAASNSQESIGSCFTNDQGVFVINNLISAPDYTVEAIPDNNSGYIGQVKNNIQSNSQQVDFVLQLGFSLSGQINRWDQTPVENAEVEISSISQDYFPQPVTSDISGNYLIMGLPSSTDYYLQVIPPSNSGLSMFINQDIVIDDNTIIQVTLSSALCISGTIEVLNSGETRPYSKNAQINVYSNNGFNQWTQSDIAGNFLLCHVPDNSDYTINVYAEGYVDQSVYQVYAGEHVDIVLSPAKRVYGSVINSRGQAIANARVELNSDMAHIPSEVTMEDGSFVFEGVPEYFNGILIDDYRLLVSASGYPETQKNNISLETDISIVLTVDESLFISGTVTDINSNPLPNGYSVIVRLYEKNQNSDNIHMKVKQALNNDGTFMFTGLNPNKTYKLKFKQFANNAEAQLQEWSGENNTGVDKKKNAIFYSPGDTVNFRFSEVWH
jgi:PKD repeat protein